MREVPPPLLLLLILPFTAAFLFPSYSQCDCNCKPQCTIYPKCPELQECAPPPPPPPIPVVPVCCSTCGTCNAKAKTARAKRAIHNTHGSGTRRPRDLIDEVVRVDAKCNSDRLRDIIIQNMDRVTAVSKRRIQQAAEAQLGGRYNVICSRGDFSYITNTEVFCQQTVGDSTCYAFKQLSDAIRRRLVHL